MKLIIHADDLGLSQGITDQILECCRGALNSTSIVPNGTAFDYALHRIRELPARPRLGVHLNLIEGASCAPARDIPLLVDGNGFFRHSFQSLLLTYYGAPRRRAALAGQVRTELAAQLGRVKAGLPENAPLYVDSHVHVHMIPFVFDQLLSLQDAFPIEYVRIPEEPFFLPPAGPAWLRGLGPNLLKHLLLNALSARAARRLRGAAIRRPDYFIGVLFTGNMTLAAVRKALEVIQQRPRPAEPLVEILFHPGGAASREAALWDRYPAYRRAYFSPNRQKEKSVLMSPEFAALLKPYSVQQIEKTP
ncbi:MAG: ChbG/HpnK family deacetylase [Lentisphaerae bacterium]|nr:ChbG/HpnK family deacetylase [Lentisphaerota bacterium]